MARKEKREKKAGLPTMSLALIGGLSLFAVIACSGYLWNKGQIQELGQQIRQHESRLEEAKRRRAALVRSYAIMCSPADLDRRVKEMKLDVGRPQPDQIVRLWEPVSPAVEEKLVAQKAAGNEEGRN